MPNKMTNFNYDLFKVSKMTNFNYDLFKASQMTNSMYRGRSHIPRVLGFIDADVLICMLLCLLLLQF